MSNSTYSKRNVPNIWGMAGVFPGTLGVYNEGDVFANKLRFVAERGFHEASIPVEALSNPKRRKVVDNLRTGFGIGFQVGLHPDLDADPDTQSKSLNQQADQIVAAPEGLDIQVVPVVVPGGRHRFQRDMPLDQQLDRLERLLTPVAARLAEAGIKPTIENHGDYYVSDLVELCHRVPGLFLMLDTGNCFLIGERPDLIPDEAYPLIYNTHFKDHDVAPSAKDLNFQLVGATLGEGQVGLESMYKKLLDLHPDPASVHLTIEWVPDPEKDAIDCLNTSLSFLERLSGGTFTPTPFSL